MVSTNNPDLPSNRIRDLELDAILLERSTLLPQLFPIDELTICRRGIT
jgi:hypothetical protein